jgi:hypothetical protein
VESKGKDVDVNTTDNIQSESVDDQTVESHAEPQKQRNRLIIPTWKVQENQKQAQENIRALRASQTSASIELPLAPPLSLADAVSIPFSIEWTEAMEKELQAMSENNIWDRRRCQRT